MFVGLRRCTPLCFTTRQISSKGLSAHLKKDIMFVLNAVAAPDSRNDEQYNSDHLEKVLDKSCELSRDITKQISLEQQSSITSTMKKYAELGFCGLAMDYQYGGSQLPLHVALLPRIPFIVANSLVNAIYFRPTSGFVALLNFCSDDTYGQVPKSPYVDKDSLFTSIAIGNMHGAVCFPRYHEEGDLTSIEGVQALPHTVDSTTTYQLKGRVDKVEGVLHEFGDNIYYIVAARLPTSERLSLFLTPRFIDSEVSLERKFRDGMMLDDGLKSNNISFENVTNCSADILFGSECGEGSISYLIGDEETTLHAIKYYYRHNDYYLYMGCIGHALAHYYGALENVGHASATLPRKSENRFAMQKLLVKKAFCEGALALGVQTSLLLHRSCSDSSYFVQYEFLSIILRIWSAHFCNSGRDISSMRENVADIEKIQLSLDLLKLLNSGGYDYLQSEIRATVEVARADQHSDILEIYVDDIEKALHRHVDTTNQYISLILEDAKNKKNHVVINSHEYVLFTGHLCIAWMWLKQGIASRDFLTKTTASESEKRFHLGKISTLDYFCNYELVKTISQSQFLLKNPQILDFAETDWIYDSRAATHD